MVQTSTHIVALLSFLALPPLLLGLVLMKLAYLPRRRGETPHCRRCNYTLTGLSSDRCPECGQALSEAAAIVHGERERRPILGGVGSLLLLLGVANTVIILASDRIDWYRYRPTGWVIDDAGSRSPGVAIRAWNELQRRMTEDGLSEAQHGRLTEVALAEQGNPTAGPIGRQLMDYLGTRAAEGKLGEAQKGRFVDQAAQFQLAVRERVAKGDPVYYSIAYKGRGPMEGWWSNHTVKEIRMDGRPVRQQGFGSSGSSLGGGGAWATSTTFDEPGEHKMEVVVEQTIRQGGGGSSDRGPVFAVREVTLESALAILDNPPADLVKLVPADESMRAQLSANIRVREAVLPLTSDSVNVQIDCQPLPVNIAFDVIGRINGEEFDIGTMTLEKNRQMSFGTGGSVKKLIEKHGRPPRITVILRGSKEAAKRSVAIYDAWEGELMFEDVVVKDKW